jgi:hypothetical protein
MAGRLTRRAFFRRSLATVAKVGLVVAFAEAARKGHDLLDLRQTWAAAEVSNDEFLAAHAGDLSRLSLGASFAPEQWPLDREGGQQALAGLDVAVRELGLRRLRLGFRWSRSVNSSGAIDLRAYAPYLDYCLSNSIDLCLNVGPIRTFRWPEEHVPENVLSAIELPPTGATVDLDSPLAHTALDYLDRLLALLKRSYGRDLIDRLEALQVENEPFYPLGDHEWLMGQDYLQAAIERADAAFPNAGILVTSAGRLNLNDVRDLYLGLLRQSPRFAGRLISGFDYHYRTPLRDSFPVVRHFDQIAYARPFAPSTQDNIRSARGIGVRMEVTEGQAEPYDYFTAPGNSAKDFRFLLLRCLNEVLDPEKPGLIRIWGVEELTKKMIAGALTPEHHQIIELIQTVTGADLSPQPSLRLPPR